MLFSYLTLTQRRFWGIVDAKIILPLIYLIHPTYINERKEKNILM